MRCTVTSEPAAPERYSVTWLFAQQDKNVTLLETDPDGLVTFGRTLDPSYVKRISASRLHGPVFQLSLRQAQTSDGGSYVCEVVEWIQASKSQWYKLPPVARTIQLTLTEPSESGWN